VHACTVVNVRMVRTSRDAFILQCDGACGPRITLEHCAEERAVLVLALLPLL
jgi:hypothetical protein